MRSPEQEFVGESYVLKIAPLQFADIPLRDPYRAAPDTTQTTMPHNESWLSGAARPKPPRSC